MATRVDIAASVRNRTDQNQSLFIADAELYEYINAAIRELHELLVETNEEYFVTTATPTLTGSSLALPADFWRLRSLDKTSGVGVSGDPIQLETFSLHDRYRAALSYRLMASTIDIAPIDDASGTYTLYYVTTPAELTDDVTVMSAVYGQYREFIELAACIPIRSKAEEASPEAALKKAKIDAIRDAASGRNSGPPAIPPSAFGGYRDAWPWRRRLP